MNVTDKNIESMNTTDPRLIRMSWLVKHPKNPDGIEADKLMKMSDEEITIAFNKWSEKNKK